jgi:spore coat polysaccharide biosynthesis predicted glycosyltransferase SpsG
VEVVNPIEGIDIDGPDEWLFTEAAMGRRRVAFVVIGNRRQGMGHVTRVRTLMESMSGHIVKAFCTPDQDLAIESLESSFFPYQTVKKEGLLTVLKQFGAHIVVHDELETSPDQLVREREEGMRIVCFEDRGMGIEYADLVFDALFPKDESEPKAGRVFGPDAYVLRDEFRFAARDRDRSRAERILVTFGGTDPSGLTVKVLEAIGPDCPIAITVVAGKGYEDFESLESLCQRLAGHGVDIELYRDVALMSDVMSTADIAFSSSGRTLYELAYLCIPTIVLAQNELELKHTFASAENGFLFLGLGREVSDEAIRASFRTLLSSAPLRQSLGARMDALDLESGRNRVVRSILEL